MLRIRLQRVGRTHEPNFRIVLTDSQNSTKSGRFKEVLGSYDPRKSSDSLEADRIKYWLSQGAKPTDSVHNLLVSHKIIDGKKIHVSTKSKFVPPEVPSTSPEAEAPASESAEPTQEAAPESGIVEEAQAPTDTEQEAPASEESAVQ